MRMSARLFSKYAAACSVSPWLEAATPSTLSARAAVRRSPAARPNVSACSSQVPAAAWSPCHMASTPPAYKARARTTASACPAPTPDSSPSTPSAHARPSRRWPRASQNRQRAATSRSPVSASPRSCAQPSAARRLSCSRSRRSSQAPASGPVSCGSARSTNTTSSAACARRSASASPLASSCSSAYSRMTCSMPKSGSPPSSRCCTRLWSTNAARPSSTSRRSGAAPSGEAQIASAASSVQPPTNTARRRNRVRSATESRSSLQATAARIVCWRASRSRAPPVRSLSWLVSRANSASGGSSRTRAAANSMASGRPSSRVHTSAIAGALAAVTRKSGRAACARARNRATAAYCVSRSSGGRCPGMASDNGGTGYTCSPRSRSGRRLVTSSFAPRLVSSNPATSGAAPTTCSKLSSTSSRCWSARWVRRSSAIGWLPASLRPSVWAMVGTTRLGSTRRERRTNQTPSANASMSSTATCKARRVLPMPPGPVTVTSRTLSRRSHATSAANCSSRPRSGVGWMGRLWRWASSVLSGGKSAGKPGSTT